MTFDRYIGIDYSGAKTPTSRLKSLQVYVATGGDPTCVRPEQTDSGNPINWTRKEIVQWLVEQAKTGRFIAGIDHGFSFPMSYFERYDLPDWNAFLDDFCEHWPTDDDHTYVDFIRDENPPRTGTSDEFRLTERWTSSAKSVFQFDIQGSVAKSTHAGIPWLRFIRQQAGDAVHFWPFDGWSVPKNKSVIAEVYPSIFRNRYPRADRTVDQQDAYAVARWLQEADEREFLGRYMYPPLTEEEHQIADREGWILGVC